MIVCHVAKSWAKHSQYRHATDKYVLAIQGPRKCRVYASIAQMETNHFCCGYSLRVGAPPIPNLRWIHLEICNFKVCLMLFEFFFLIFFSFTHFWKIAITQMCISWNLEDCKIILRHTCSPIFLDWMKNKRVMCNFKNTYVIYAYRVNRFMEQL